MKLVGGKLVPDDTEDTFTPEPDDSKASDDRICEEAGCGQVLYYAGRGRPPRFCEDHKPISPSRSSGSTQPRRTAAIRNETALREALAARYAMLAMVANWRNPNYANNIRANIDRAVEADIAYARVSPSFRKALESLIEKSAAGEVIAVHAMMLFPIAVGEANRRSRPKAPKGPGEAPNGRQTAAPTPPPQPPRPTGPNVAQPPRPGNVHPIRDPMMPAEHEGSPEPETINAAAMDGMPSP